MKKSLRIFEGFGIELEYMIVDEASLNVRPLSDELLRAQGGAYVSEIEVGELAWSNELVLHVIELKTNGPAPALSGLAAVFARDIRRINETLQPMGALLMPTGMHPWMDPAVETRLWPHEYNRVYETFDRIFDCRGHGWSNLQSIHVNLPFQGDDEFGRLHAAIRMVLPILPALAASTPIANGRATGFMDTRLDYYRYNCRRVPTVAGHLIPEAVFTEDEYQTRLLEPLYRDISPFDPEGILSHEWLNARGAIARFDRRAIEIRLLDIQESPRADLAICAVVVELVKALVEERWVSFGTQKQWKELQMLPILDATIRAGEAAEISDVQYLRDIGIADPKPMSAGQVWHELLTGGLSGGVSAEHWTWVEVLLQEGSLARRLLRAWNGTREGLPEIYRSLCQCLVTDRLFRPCSTPSS